MPNKKISKNHTVIPNGMSEDVDTSESEDEINKTQKIFKNQLLMKDNSSSSETSDDEETFKPSTSKPKPKKKKSIHWVKKPFVPPTSTFVESLPPPPINSAQEPIDYFYSMFGKESFNILKNQSNLYSVQVNPNRPVNISETEIHQFIVILIMTGVYCFPQERFYWMNSTRVQSIASVEPRSIFTN